MDLLRFIGSKQMRSNVRRCSGLNLGKPRISGPSVSTRKNFVSYQRPWLYWQGIVTKPNCLIRVPLYAASMVF